MRVEFAVLDRGGEVAPLGQRLPWRRRRIHWRRPVAGIGRQERVRRDEFRILPAGPDMHRVVRILVKEPERGVVDVAAAEIPEVVEAQDLIDVLGGRIVIVDDAG